MQKCQPDLPANLGSSEELLTEYLFSYPCCSNIAPRCSDERRTSALSLPFEKSNATTEIFMRAASIAGFILVGLGIALLVYSVSPVLLLVHAAEQHQTNLLLPILGGVTLLCGIALLFAARPRD
jgi:hypothetical protein